MKELNILSSFHLSNIYTRCRPLTRGEIAAFVSDYILEVWIHFQISTDTFPSSITCVPYEIWTANFRYMRGSIFPKTQLRRDLQKQWEIYVNMNLG